MPLDEPLRSWPLSESGRDVDLGRGEPSSSVRATLISWTTAPESADQSTSVSSFAALNRVAPSGANARLVTSPACRIALAVAIPSRLPEHRAAIVGAAQRQPAIGAHSYHRHYGGVSFELVKRPPGFQVPEHNHVVGMPAQHA